MTTLALASRLQSLISELTQRIVDSPVSAPIRRLIARKYIPLDLRCWRSALLVE
jgi:hypothetical protein